jgi:hypothetical protein
MKPKLIIIISTVFIIFTIYSRLFDWLDFIDYRDRIRIYENFEFITLFLLPVILLTSITIGSEQIYSYWWRFAKYALPVCLIIVTAIGFGILHTNTVGTFGWGDILNQMYDAWGLGLTIGTFIVGSLIQIFRGYRAGKRAAPETTS